MAGLVPRRIVRLWAWLLLWAHGFVAQMLAGVVRRPLRWLLGLIVGMPPRPGDTSVAATWLTRVLREKKVLKGSQRVVRVINKQLDANRGLVGAMLRLEVTYSPSDVAAPVSLILKTSRNSATGRRATVAGGTYREATFYGSTFAATSPNGLLPDILYTHASSLLGEYVVLMEDLKLRKTVGLNFVFGNQCWGVPPLLDPHMDEVAVLTNVFQLAADVHARNWRLPKLKRARWLKNVDLYAGKGRAAWESAIQRSRRGWATAKARFTAEGSRVTLSDKIIRVMDNSFAAASWDKLQQHLHDPSVPWTLTHGDFHAGNMVIAKEWDDADAGGGDGGNAGAGAGAGAAAAAGSDASILLYDWSEVGVWEPTADLGQTLISDVRPEIFRKHSQALVRHYWQCLTTHAEAPVSPSEYPFEQCWAEFQRSGAERWVWVFGVLASFPGLPPAAVQYFHDQLLAFCEAHGSPDCYQLKPVVFVPA